MNVRITRPQRFLASGGITILVLLMMSLFYVVYEPKIVKQEFVEFSAGAAPPACALNRFSVTNVAGCRTSNALFCPASVYVQKCMNDALNPDNVLNYCMNGFCGNRVLSMNFEQSPPADVSGANNNGQCTPSGTGSRCPIDGFAGRKGKGSLFQLNGMAVNIPTLGKSLPQQFTLLGWAKPSSVTGRRAVITNKDDESSSTGLALITTNNKEMVMSIGSYSTTSAVNTLVLNDWNHIAATVDFIAGNVKLYHNGQEKTPASTVGTITGAIDPVKNWKVGMFLNVVANPNSFIGQLDELHIVPRLLSSQEIQNDMALAFSCGNKIVENTYGATEECDDGKQCSDGTDCTDDGDVMCGIPGDCQLRGGDGCDATCKFESCPTSPCATGEACVAGTCVADCVDTDGTDEEGLFILGSTTSGATTAQDYCSELYLYYTVGDTTMKLADGNLLVEQMCNNGAQEKLVINCACADGKCIDLTNGIPPASGCIDTDGGVVNNVRGTARDNDNTKSTNDAVWGTDYCLWNGPGPFTTSKPPCYNALREFSCDANGKVTSTIVTDKLCQNGVIVGVCT